MKILHSSDWHLGKKLDHFSRLPEQIEMLKEIKNIADEHNVDAIILAGDIFDNFNPPIEALSLFYKEAKKMTNDGKRPIIAIAGNHDSADRFESPEPLAKECGIFLAGKPDFLAETTNLDTGVEISKTDRGFLEVSLPNYDYPLRIIATAYANEQRLKTAFNPENTEEELRDYLQKYWADLADKYCDKEGVNILLSHLFIIKKDGEIPEEPEDEKPILHVGGVQSVYSSNIPKQMDYVALGHLHRKQMIDDTPCPIIYSGSPLSFSFSEANQKKYVLILDLEPGNDIKIEEVELKSGKPLLRKKCNGVSEAIEWLEANKDALVELTIVSDEFLTAENKRSLYDAHDGIISIIPQVTQKIGSANGTEEINMAESVTEHFRNYFKAEHGQDPNDEIMDLFKEIISEEK